LAEADPRLSQQSTTQTKEDAMREIDRRSKIDRRNFLKTAGAVPPAVAVAASTAPGPMTPKR
jgi:hypothetical protein